MQQNVTEAKDYSEQILAFFDRQVPFFLGMIIHTNLPNKPLGGKKKI